jgi:multidrug efflux pump subunit AcrA (membrane-fusion protein)
MKSAWKVCAILFLATGLVAQTSTAPKPKKAKPAPATLTAADVQSLKDAIAAQQAALAQQQQQIQELRDELHRKDQGVQQAQSAATDAAAKADAAQAQASQQQQTVGELKTDVTDLKANLANTVVTVQETQKIASESPTAIHFKGITVSPGGFLAAETVWRSRALAADVNTPFNSVTMPGASASNMSEFFGSGRQSRISMLAEGRLASVKLSGYVEADFLSAGVSSNNNQSNSYSLRQRQAWGQAAFDNGWTFTGGQMWSLLTETKHGVDNRTEALPMTIDAAYTAGFSWARQYGVRLSKNFNNRVWAAVSVEESQETLSTHNNVNNFLVGSAGAGGGVYNGAVTTCTTSVNSSGAPVTTCTNAANYSFNPSPDIIAKLVFEPGFGHYEIFGVFSRFRDRVFPCEDVSASATTPCGTGTTPGVANASDAFNSSRNGGGIGANARFSFANKHIDFGLHAVGGSGIGRYGASGLADASVRANGTLALIKNYQGLATLEWHGPKLDFYLNAGAEYNSRTAGFDPITGKYVGYGSPFFNNLGCSTETGPGPGGFLPGGLGGCTADTRVLVEGTAGFWWKLYDGSRAKVNKDGLQENKSNKGRIQFGPQYSYVTRNAWSGSSYPNEPHGIDNLFFTSFRYYLP